MFENIDLGTGTSVISSFLQDQQGLIWIGSSKGLFSYDGYSVKSHFQIGEYNNTQIYCGVIVDSVFLYLGSDNGLLIFNITTDRYEDLPLEFPGDIRSLALQNELLWIGSLNGLYCYNLRDRTLKHFSSELYPNLPHNTIYSIITTQQDQIFVGTYDGFCRYIPEKDAFQKITLPENPRKNNQFINSLLEDTKRQCIWIGMEGSLLKYGLNDTSIEKIDEIQENSVKSLTLDANAHLLAGTDNGLYVFSENKLIQHIVHDARNQNSLYNNIIWSVFTDQDKNIWLGTDYGISLSHQNKDVQYVSISEITGTGDGNQFYSIFRDSKGYFWLGGTNGIIRASNKKGDWTDAIWYNTESPDYPLPHGRIRHIYEDKDADLWIATDGSINRYDYSKEQFIQYNIIDSTGTLNTNWAYSLFEDDKDQLWIATCLGGIFIVDKNKLLENHNANYVADYNFNTENGLSGMFVNQIVPDHQGNVWVLLYNNGIDKINIDTRKVEKFPLGENIGKNNPSYLLCDSKGYIWAGFNNGVMHINPENNHTDTLLFDASKTNEVLTMMETGGNIWVSTSDGFWLVDVETLKSRYLNLTKKRFVSIFHDTTDDNVYLGGMDGIAVTDPYITTSRKTERPIIATGLYVNSELITDIQKSIRYTQELNLNYQQNNIALEISDLPYSIPEKSKIIYRMDGIETDWNVLSSNTNRINYSNLRHGKYTLIVSKFDLNGKPSKQHYQLSVIINPPWYFTNIAKIMFGLILISFTGWIINFFRVKNRLRIERIEKEKIAEQSSMKLEFLTNLSHELKTPLSLIIAPISRIIPGLKNAEEKQQLKQVQQNAMKLNSLIHQILDFNRIDSNSNSLLILSRIDIVSFSRKLFNTFKEADKGQKYTFSFETNFEKLYLELDVIKWESILGNLLSNAMKYSSKNDHITLSLNYSEHTKELEISVSDTGRGIPAQDMPYIFQRFFQSSKTSGTIEGTGIGLYLVKTFTELHGGMVNVTSKENSGTTVTILLPVPSSDILPNESTRDLDEKSELPLVLIVDDNAEIAAFLQKILQADYKCMIASDGDTGLKLCLEHLPDLVISDEMMPGMSGLEMCSAIRKNIPTSTTPIILLTAKDDKNTELESIQLNIDAFIPKPFEADILYSRVKQLIGKKQNIEKKLRMESIATPKTSDTESLDEKFLSQITKIIEEHLDDPDLNVTALCDISGVNNKQIYRKIKQLTGKSPVDYIKSIRMKKAAMLLHQKKFTVAEVMYMVGFSNHSYFSKCFKAEFNRTPAQYAEMK